MKEKKTMVRESGGRKFGITAKVVVILLVISLVTIGSMAVLNLYAFKSMGDMTKKDTQSLFRRQTKEHLERIVTDKTTLCENDLEEIKDLVYAEEAFALELFYNGTDHKYIEQTLDTQYSAQPDDPVPANAPSDFQYSEKFQRMLSLKYLAIKPAPGINLTYDQNDKLFSPDPEVNKTLHTFSQMISLFRSTSGEHSTIKWVYIGTPAGLHFSYPGHGPYGESYDCRLRGWYKRANESGEFGWSDPYVDASGQGLMITASKPVYDSNNKLLGVVAADVTIETINNELISLDSGESGYTYLIDSEGAVISKPEYEAGDVRWDNLYPLAWRHNTSNEELNNITKKMMRGESGSAIITLDGEKKYIVFAPIKSVGWSLAAVLPEKEALGEVIEIEKEIDNNMDTQINSIIVVTIVMTIIVIICGIVFGGTLTKPIIKLTDTAKAMSEGNLDVKTDVVYSGDEIGDLAKSFDTMNLSLRKSYETLEEKIRDRTNELSEE
ncbi:MAG: HAMP domain-containing protein [Bacteroidetes bacterium]|nr:HAMP domain-containing protein [Bacteroidota bacterium]